MVIAPALMDDLLYFFTVLPLVTLAWIVLALWSARMYLLCARRGAWLSSLLAMVMPVLLVLGILHPWDYVSRYRYLGDRIHFVVMLPSYDRQIATLSHDRFRYAEFNWGGMLFASRGVVYDESDQILMPRSQRSAAWVARIKDTDLMCGDESFAIDAERLWDHYYLTGFGC
jgi:hypothetical protein